MAVDILPGGRWWEECGCVTNHTTEQHLAAAWQDEGGEG